MSGARGPDPHTTSVMPWIPSYYTRKPAPRGRKKGVTPRVARHTRTLRRLRAANPTTM